MQFLSWTECEKWCAVRDVPIGETDSALSAPYHTVEFVLPSDAEEKVRLARFLFSLIEPSPEVLLWVDESDVGSVGRHLPLFTRLRESLGEWRPLFDFPGHLASVSETNDAISVLTVALLFGWDCHVLTASGHEAFYVSHNGCAWFASRDPAVAARARHQIATAFAIDELAEAT
jgi:hypothetical protein